MEESHSIPQPRIDDHTTEDSPHEVTYQLLGGGTKRAKTKLADSDAYTQRTVSQSQCHLLAMHSPTKGKSL